MRSFALLLAVVFSVGRADAGVIFTFVETGGNVQMTGSGSLNAASFTAIGAQDFGLATGLYSPSSGSDYMAVQTAGLFYNRRIGFVSSNWNNLWNVVVAPNNTTGNKFATADFSGGSPIPGLTVGSSEFDLITNTWSASGIVWTFNSTTFAALGISTGDYTVGSGADTITMRFGSFAAVPEPSSFALIGAIGAFGVWKRRRSQKVA